MGPRHAGPRRQRRNVRSGEGSRLRGEESRRESRISPTSRARMRENSPTLGKETAENGQVQGAHDGRQARPRRGGRSLHRVVVQLVQGRRRSGVGERHVEWHRRHCRAVASRPHRLAGAASREHRARARRDPGDDHCRPCGPDPGLRVHPLDRQAGRQRRRGGRRPDHLVVARPCARDRARDRGVAEHAGRRRGHRADPSRGLGRSCLCTKRSRPRRQAVRRHSRAAGCTCRHRTAAARAPPAETPADIPAEPPSEPTPPDDAPRAS